MLIYVGIIKIELEVSIKKFVSSVSILLRVDVIASSHSTVVKCTIVCSWYTHKHIIYQKLIRILFRIVRSGEFCCSRDPKNLHQLPYKMTTFCNLRRVPLLLLTLYCSKIESSTTKRMLGWAYDPNSNGFFDGAVEIETFLDLQCSDSQKAWTIFKEVANYYDRKVIYITNY